MSLDTNPSASLHVLAADDDAMGARLIGMFLQRLGHQPTVVGSGMEVLTLVEAQQGGDTPWDLLLLDIEMPGMDGFTTLDRLRRAGFTLATVALTGHNGIEHRERCLQAGFNGFLGKPLRLADLDAEIRRVKAQGAPESGVAPAAAPAAPAPAPAVAASTSWLSRALQELDINEDTLAILLRAFLANSRNDALQVRQAVQEADCARLQHHAHRLRGSLGSLAMHELAAQAKIMELAARDQQLAQAAAVAGVFAEGFDALCDAASQWLQQRSA